jgi:hypothetical protein
MESRESLSHVSHTTSHNAAIGGRVWLMMAVTRPLLAAAYPCGVVADWPVWLGAEEAALIEFLRRQTGRGGDGRAVHPHSWLASRTA